MAKAIPLLKHHGKDIAYLLNYFCRYEIREEPKNHTGCCFELLMWRQFLYKKKIITIFLRFSPLILGQSISNYHMDCLP